MDYTGSLNYLNSFLNLERILFHPDNRLWNLERMRRLFQCFRNPERSFFPVLIAGTKGKGSTGFFLESILTKAGVKVGFYSSPHLETPLERIRVNGCRVKPGCWVDALRLIKKGLAGTTFSPGGDFTYFEVLTLAAALIFKAARVQVGIFEAGMGGRLDATNALESKLAILTPISLDHEAFLGNTVRKIAQEKVEILRPFGDVVTGCQPPEAMKVIRAKVRSLKALRWRAPGAAGVKPGLLGDFQNGNAGLALQAALLLASRYGYPVTRKHIRDGIRTSGWPGRLEKFKGRPFYLLDAAHNPFSVAALLRSLKKLYPHCPGVLVFGTSQDKKSEKMLDLLSHRFGEVILTRAQNPRSCETGVLLAQAVGKFDRVYAAAGVREALDLARKIASPDRWVLVTGSFYVIGEARGLLRKKNQRGGNC